LPLAFLDLFSSSEEEPLELGESMAGVEETDEADEEDDEADVEDVDAFLEVMSVKKRWCDKKAKAANYGERRPLVVHLCDLLTCSTHVFLFFSTCMMCTCVLEL
jgi:hypothetical protein